ncbi:Thioesterase superfamily [Penicillium frequentans]|uniref:Thioesterase superfamily n=1 Tax=Penicillium frequentans TaxID=3151616 RepID=A0AAD6D1D7_9EURO|nr:Thioesterase superfamily [Penicillium glabrum]
MLRPSYIRLSPSLTTLSPRLTPSPTRLLTQRLASYPLHANNHRFQSTAQTPYISTPPPPKQSRIRRVAGFVSIALIAFTAGLTYTSYRTVSKIMAEPILSDEQTLSAFKPVDETAEEINTTLQNHPDAVALRANPEFKESRPHLKIPESMRPPHERDGKSLVSLMYLGSEICGHPGIIHGGLLATLLDEGLARCCFPALPNKIGVTANLNIDYRAPAMADSYVALRAETVKVEGRKAWVEGRIETLPLDGSDPVVLVQAKALFIEPKQAAALSQLYRGANE